MKKTRIYITILTLIIINISSIVLIQGDNIFWGKDKIKEKSGIIQKTENGIETNLSIFITSPAQGGKVSKTFTAKGTAGKRVKYVEVKLDDGKWQIATGVSTWMYTFVTDKMGSHIIYARSKSKYNISPVVSVNFIVTLPAPTKVTVSDGTYTNKIVITWNNVKDAEKYYIYRSISSHGPYLNIDNTLSTNYDDTSVQRGIKYYYKVQAYSSIAGYGLNSNYDGGYIILIKTIDTGGGNGTSIAVNGNNIYIGYSGLKLAKSLDGGNTWITNTVDSGGLYISIAENKNNIYISYYNSGLKFAKSTNIGNTWTTNKVDNDGMSGYHSSIAAWDNNIYISYEHWFPCNLKFAKSTNRGNIWMTNTIDNSDNTRFGTSIAVNGNNIYISYHGWPSMYLYFAKSTNKGVTWITNTVDSTGSVGDDNSIAIEENNIYISYQGAGKLKVAKSSDAGINWITSTVDSNGTTGAFSSIAVDGNNIFISYYDNINSSLKFAYSEDNGNIWTTRTIDNNGTLGSWTSLKIDNNYIYISYYDNTNDTIKFAKLPR